MEQRTAFVNQILANYGLSGKNEQRGAEQIRILTIKHKDRISQLQKQRESKINDPEGFKALTQQQEIIRDIYTRQLNTQIER